MALAGKGRPRRPPSTQTLVGSDVDLDRTGLQLGTLRVPYSHNRSAYGHLPVPIFSARHGSGPTVLLIAGVHGDEYEGPLAISGLIRRFPLKRLEGRVIAVPMLNAPAVLSGTRTSPIDGVNLNRAFPGDCHGTPTAMLAHYVESVLMPKADYCLDFHAGGTSLNYLPALIIDRQPTGSSRRRLERVVAAFAPPRVLYMDMLGEDRVIAAAARRQGVCFATGEFGGGGTVSVEGLEMVDRGLRAVLEGLGVLSAPSRPAAHPPRSIPRYRVDGHAHYVFAARSGIFEPRFALGEVVRRDQIAGYIHDPRDVSARPSAVRFGAAGTVFCTRTLALVSAGDCLAHLGVPVAA